MRRQTAAQGPAVEDREAADSRRAKLSSLEETKDVDPSVSPRKVQMQRVGPLLCCWCLKGSLLPPPTYCRQPLSWCDVLRASIP